jgi:hypothetical protein
MNMYSTNPPKPGAIEENAAQFESDLAKADTVRATHLSGLQKLRAAKTNRDQRELKLIADNLGEDHPRVVRLKTDVAAGQRLTQVLGVEVDRTTAARPAGDEHSWTVYGFVRDSQLQGQDGLTVALYDRANRWMEAIGYACTDSRGCFQLRYDPGADKLQEVFIRVLNQKRQILYRDKKPMRAVLGEIKYREIVLNGESDSCQPPSDPSSKEPPRRTKSPAKSKSRKTRARKKAPGAKKN